MVLRFLAVFVTLVLTLSLAGSAAAAPYDGGLSNPVEDTYYPAKGDPGVDALHYDLQLTWLKKHRQLRGVAEVRFRATSTDRGFQLDLSRAMRVRSVTVGGVAASYGRSGHLLLVNHPVVKDRRYTARIAYRGTPKPAKGPSTRSDVTKVGMRVTKDGQLWTMQEPYGAFTWYPSNDQPSDKALYDVSVNVPGKWVGVSNGRMTDRRTVNGRTVTEWSNRHPMASYLTTLAVGPYRRYHQAGPHGLPMTYWVPSSRPGLVKPLLKTPAALRWLERRLGRYPFDRVGIVLTPSGSAMETQTMITFGVKNFNYGIRDARGTIVHELAHDWYGNTTTPRDWRDMWMNEGMATYQDTRWAAQQGWTTWRHWQREWKRDDQLWRDLYGAPGNYHRGQFAAVNVYYCTALMWDRLRLRIGTATFNRLVRTWPQAHRDSNQSRATLVRWFEAGSGKELSGFFHKWLNSKKSPA